MHCPCLSASRMPVCLPPNAFGLRAGDTMTVTGWGHLKENGEKNLIIVINCHLVIKKRQLV